MPNKPPVAVAYSQGKYNLAKVLTMKPTAEEISRNKAAKGESVEATAESAEAAPVSTTPIISEEPIDFSKVEIETLFADFVDFDTFAKPDFRAVKVKECEAVKKPRSS